MPMVDEGQRAGTKPILLSAGINFPVSSPERWDAFVRGTEPLPFSAFELDSLSLNELSIALEIRCGVKLSPAALAAMHSVEELAELIAPPTGASARPEQGTNVDKKSVKRLVLDKLYLDIRDLIGTATPSEFLDLSAAGAARNSSRWTQFGLLRVALGILTKWPNLVRQATPIEKIARLIHRTLGDGERIAWSRKHRAKDVLIYRSDKPSTLASCLIVFGGNERRPMMPMGLFLAALGDLTDTVIFLRTEINEGFRSGISGLGIDLETAFANLGTVIDTTVPEERRAALPPVVLGTSGGGIPALVFSGFYPVRSVVIVGPNSTRDVRWSANPQLERVLESRRRVASDGNEVPVTVVYGELGNDAHKVSDWKSDIAGAALIEIPGAEHNALLPLVEEGTLLSNLREWINPASPSRKKRP
jgi:hypothetical protein